MVRLVAYLRRHPIGVGVVVLALLVSGVLVWLDEQHRYDISTSEVEFRYGGDRIVGTLASPRGRGPHGLVVFIHGDGATNADNSEGYRPIWESFARAGYASFSWDKPGVDRSEGNWLDYSMSERADLAIAALDAVAKRPDIDPTRIGLWGASQAGWVLPKIALRRSDVRFIIAVSPGINWLDQGRFNLLAELEDEGASQAEIDEAVEFSDSIRALLRRGATYADYRALADTAPERSPERVKEMSRQRWNFVKENFRSDARRDLAALEDVPVLLQVGGKDRNVDVAETEAVYRELLGDSLTVRRYPEAAHSMVQADLEDGVRGWLTGVFDMRALFAEGFLADGEAFLARQSDAD